MALSRKHYTAIAKVFDRVLENIAQDRVNPVDPAFDVWNQLRLGIADVLAKDNPRFDLQRFYAACQK